MERQRHRRSVFLRTERPRKLYIQRNSGSNLVVLDTDILVGLLKGVPEAFEAIKSLEASGSPLSTTIVTVYELVKGAYLSSKPEDNLAKVRESISSLQVLDLSVKACEEAAKIYRDLRKKGCLIGEFDILIAAIVKANEEALVSRDEHFNSLFRGTKLIKW